MNTVTIVGASVAGWHTASALRGAGFTGRLNIVGRETHMPYDRPALSKKILTGRATADDIRLATNEARAALKAEWALGTEATRLRASDRAVDLSDGSTLNHDAVVIATGLRAPDHPLLASLPGGVHQLRTLDDALAAREALARARRVVVVGGGFVGSEIASAARELGVEVVLLEADKAIGARALGVHAPRLAALHDAAGVDVRTRSQVVAVLGDDRVAGVQLEDGSTVAGDTVFLGLGSQPATDWLIDSGLDLVGGVASDAYGRTLLPGVFVAGDVGRYESPWSPEPRRFEHWTSAVEQAASVANLIVGRDPASPRPPYFWFDIHGHFIQVAGAFPPDSSVHVLAESGSAFLAVHRHDDLDVGVFAINSQRDFARARRSLQPPHWKA